MNSTFMEILMGANIAALSWNLFFMMGLVVERNELLKEWKAWIKEKDHE